MTGSDVTLTVTEAAQNLTLDCGAGSFTLTGSDVTFTASIAVNYVLECNPGSYDLTGSDITINKGLVVGCDAGSFSLIPFTSPAY